MKIFLERTESNYKLILKKPIFRKVVLDSKKFNALHEKTATFFEKRTLTKELRSSNIKISRQKYDLYEEKRENHIIGVIEVKKMKMTWAFLCFLQQEIKDFLESDETFLNIPQKSY